MNGSRNRVGMGMLVGCAFIVTAVLSGCGPSKPDRDVKRLADFEDGTMGVWKATGGATAEVASAHASQGTKALHVTLPAEDHQQRFAAGELALPRPLVGNPEEAELDVL